MPPLYTSPNAFMPYAAHDTAVRSALRRAGVASAKIERIMAEEAAAQIVFSAPITHIITSPGLVTVWLRGWISSISGIVNHFEFHFPPNEPEYLAEIKRAQDSNMIVEGTCVLDPGTNLLVLKEIIVTDIGSPRRVEISSISESAVAALQQVAARPGQ